MRRLSRINTIWRKELFDTLRDRRTLIAMILVPIVLYPVMILGSLQGFEFQISRLQREQYTVAVARKDVGRWLRTVIDTDIARRPGVEPNMPAEVLVEKAETGELPAEEDEAALAGERQSAAEAARAGVRRQPPEYTVEFYDDPNTLRDAITAGVANIGLVVDGEFPSAAFLGTTRVTILIDQTDIRSKIAAAGLEAILTRAAEHVLANRLSAADLKPEFVQPLTIQEQHTAPPEKVGGSILGQIVPLILIVMTITGAIYPAIDLTAGERERGTLETLMVAPVPTVDLIAGKFVVVAMIGMLSAGLNLLSIGGTIYLGGLGNLLTQGSEVVIPLTALPWVLVVLVPLAVMFSAILLAVCSFARSFKEAQNYVMPVMVAALIPAVVGILPGTRLEGPLLIMPVTNITILTRDLFTGKFDIAAIVWVTASTTLYAGAAVAVAARLFGQEAVLFSDSGSIKTLFQRKFFKPSDTPTAAQAFLLLAVVYSLNFFLQQTLLADPDLIGTPRYWMTFGILLVTLFVLVPVVVSLYLRVRVTPALSLRPPPTTGIIAALCFGLSTWVLIHAWYAFQKTWLPLPPQIAEDFGFLADRLTETPLLVMLVFMALVPAICEEIFFRGFALSGLRSGVGVVGAVVITAIAFGIHHHSIHRLFITTGLGLMLGLLVVRYRSLWPAIIAHLMHNGMSVLAAREDALLPYIEKWGYVDVAEKGPPLAWLLPALALATVGLLLCLWRPAGRSAAAAAPETTPQLPDWPTP